MNDRELRLQLIEDVVELLTDKAGHARIAERAMLLRHVCERRRGNGAKTKLFAKQLGVTEGAMSLRFAVVESKLLDLIK